MDFLSLAKQRYSCRAYKSDPIDPVKLERALEAMRFAPSACNRQPYRLYVLETARYRDALQGIYRQPWFVEAPLVVAMVAFLEESWCHRDGKNLGLVDAAIAFDHFLLAATEQGLGSCWVAAFHRLKAFEFLNLPETADILAFSPIGLPDGTPPIKERKRLEQLVTYGVR
jgi:nitroreductase